MSEYSCVDEFRVESVSSIHILCGLGPELNDVGEAPENDMTPEEALMFCEVPADSLFDQSDDS